MGDGVDGQPKVRDRRANAVCGDLARLRTSESQLIRLLPSVRMIPRININLL